METKLYIEMLKRKTKDAEVVAARQALVYFLRKEGIPFKIISEILGYSSRLMYMHYDRFDNLVSVGDRISVQAIEELKAHEIIIRPCILDGSVMKRVTGYRMTIDNTLY